MVKLIDLGRLGILNRPYDPKLLNKWIYILENVGDS
jgi:hypothetical protein